MSNVSVQHHTHAKRVEEAAAFLIKKTTEYQTILDAVPAAEAKLAGLDAAYAEQQRIADLDLSLKIRENKTFAFIKIAGELNNAVISGAKLQALQNSINSAEQAQVDAVNKCEIRSKQAIDAAVATAKATAALEQAELRAQLTTAQSQLTFLTDQMAQMRVDNDAQRVTATAMVTAATRGQVNVTSAN
jgi:hypothetical protein